VSDAKIRAYIEAQEGTRLNDDYRIKDFDRAEYERVRAHFQEGEQ
jgi:hypothetical protein